MDGLCIRLLAGIRCFCLDVGCDDFDNATRNRHMVKNKENIGFWLAMEAAIRHTPARTAFAAWIPTGDIPIVNREDWRQNKGQMKGSKIEEVIPNL